MFKSFIEILVRSIGTIIVLILFVPFVAIGIVILGTTWFVMKGLSKINKDYCSDLYEIENGIDEFCESIRTI